MAGGAGDCVGVAAGHDMQNALFVRDLRHGEGERRIDVAEQKVDLVAVDQLARLLHRLPGVAAGRVLDDELSRASENPALGVDLVERHLAADHLILAGCGVSAGERIVESEFHRVGGAGADDERTANWATASAPLALTSLRRSMPARQLDLGKLRSLVSDDLAWARRRARRIQRSCRLMIVPTFVHRR